MGREEISEREFSFKNGFEAESEKHALRPCPVFKWRPLLFARAILSFPLSRRECPNVIAPPSAEIIRRSGNGGPHPARPLCGRVTTAFFYILMQDRNVLRSDLLFMHIRKTCSQDSITLFSLQNTLSFLTLNYQLRFICLLREDSILGIERQ